LIKNDNAHVGNLWRQNLTLIRTIFSARGMMKEQTYGWYPSAKNVYDDRRMDTLTPYRKLLGYL